MESLTSMWCTPHLWEGSRNMERSHPTLFGIFFLNWHPRCVNFQECQKKKCVPYNSFIQHLSTIWLTLGPSVCWTIDHWLALLKYFLHCMPLKKHLKNAVTSAKYLKIVIYLKRKYMLAELKFVFIVWAFYEIQRNISDEQTPCVCYSWWSEKLLTVLARLLKPDILISADEISTNLLKNLDNCLQDTIVGDQVGPALYAQELILA